MARRKWAGRLAALLLAWPAGATWGLDVGYLGERPPFERLAACPELTLRWLPPRTSPQPIAYDDVERLLTDARHALQVLDFDRAGARLDEVGTRLGSLWPDAGPIADAWLSLRLQLAGVSQSAALRRRAVDAAAHFSMFDPAPRERPLQMEIERRQADLRAAPPTTLTPFPWPVSVAIDGVVRATSWPLSYPSGLTATVRYYFDAAGWLPPLPIAEAGRPLTQPRVLGAIFPHARVAWLSWEEAEGLVRVADGERIDLSSATPEHCRELAALEPPVDMRRRRLLGWLLPLGAVLVSGGTAAGLLLRPEPSGNLTLIWR